LALLGAHAAPRALDIPAPAFTQSDPEHWINSAPLAWTELRGRVVVLDVWTSDCVNCIRSLPWLRLLERRFEQRGLRVVGIHSPEFGHERDHARVRAKATEFGLTHPIMLDDDFAYWRALGNRYWPAFYLVDKRGRMRAVFIGETHAGDEQAKRVAREIEALLAE
jgi:thiol-disulfide isomerase/thioredoxin